MSRYRVPAGPTRLETRFGNSRFITTVDRCDTLAAAHERLRCVRGEFPDATHHVHAFRIGHGASVQEALSDDGEPSGTAGPPVMSVLRGVDLGDAAVIVTRYFGGTKLGTGGLVTAYQESARAALSAAATELRIDRVDVRFRAPYALIEPLRRLVLAFDGLIEDEEFAADVNVRARVDRDRLDEFQRRLSDLSSGRVRAERAE